MDRFSDPELLVAAHSVAGFDCGVPSLNRWLIEYGVVAQNAHSARTRVVRNRDDDRVIAYHSLAMGAIAHVDATKRAKAGVSKHQPIPAVLLARLAVDRAAQGNGLGGWLLNDALRRALSAAENIAARAILVHAISDGAARFYRHFGFEPAPTDPRTLQLLVKDVRASLDAA